MKTKIYIVAINNLSLNSFSEKGNTLETALLLANKQRELGADYIDFGAQSTAPGASQITEAEEKSIINKLLQKYHDNSHISIDTTRGSVADSAAKQGVAIINDISGFRFDTKMLKAIVDNKHTQYVLTHSQGQFDTMHKKYHYKNIAKDIDLYFKKNIKYLNEIGIDSSRIIVDFGFGFSKSSEQNIELLYSLDTLPVYKKVMVGISRKKCIQNLSDTKILPELDTITNMFHVYIAQRLIDIGTEEIYIRTHTVEQARLLRKTLICLNP